MSQLTYERIYEVVRQIPYGRVATYGQIAYIVGPPSGPRQVGWALSALRNKEVEPHVPWHRVMNAQGASSVGVVQIDLLEEEGVVSDSSGKINLDRFGWNRF